MGLFGDLGEWARRPWERKSAQSRRKEVMIARQRPSVCPFGLSLTGRKQFENTQRIRPKTGPDWLEQGANPADEALRPTDSTDIAQVCIAGQQVLLHDAIVPAVDTDAAEHPVGIDPA